MDIQKLMEQAEKMQKELAAMEENLGDEIYEGNSGGQEGVTIRVNGNHEVQEVIISEDLMNSEDREMLQDMVLLAVNDAINKALQDREDRLDSVTAGLKLPGMK